MRLPPNNSPLAWRHERILPPVPACPARFPRRPPGLRPGRGPRRSRPSCSGSGSTRRWRPGCRSPTPAAWPRRTARPAVVTDADPEGHRRRRLALRHVPELPEGPGTRGQPARGAELLLAAAGPAGPGGRGRRGAVRRGLGRRLARPARRGRQPRTPTGSSTPSGRGRSNSGRPGTTAGTSGTATRPLNGPAQLIRLIRWLR